MTRTGERTTVTGEAVPGVALTCPPADGCHGISLSQIAEALELRIPGLDDHTQSSTAS
jgi:hypothetical protein